jgi:hypothetical protein
LAKGTLVLQGEGLVFFTGTNPFNVFGAIQVVPSVEHCALGKGGVGAEANSCGENQTWIRLLHGSDMAFFLAVRMSLKATSLA